MTLSREPPASRYAIYYTPAPEHPLTVAARAWLGRDAFAGGEGVRSARDWEAQAPAPLVADPYRYGFHGTLKAPFRLQEGMSLQELEQALRLFAVKLAPTKIGPLKIVYLRGFFALVPKGPYPELRTLASQIVQQFDRFRSPMTETERQKRLRAPLDKVETSNLHRWGYPHVLERFNFHLTLTDRVSEGDRARIERQLNSVFEPYLGDDYVLDTISLFAQEAGADFLVRSQFPLQG